MKPSKPWKPKNPPDLTGLTVKAATELAGKFGYVVRMVEKDGQSFVITCDVQGNRINLVVASIVIATTIG
jgi:hypothetical protein